MPADAFTFAIFIRRQQQLFGTFQSIFELSDNFFLVLRNDIQRLEIRLSIHAKIGPFLAFRRSRNLAGVIGKVTDVAHGRLDLESLREKAADGAGFRGAFNDDEGVRHRRAMNRSPSLSHRPALCMIRIGFKRRYSRLSAMDSGRHARDGCFSSRHPGDGCPW